MSGTYTARDYLSWKFEGFVELIRGKIFKMTPSPLPPHQIVSRKLLRFFLNFFPEDAKCQVFEAPSDVFLVKEGQHYKDTQNVVQPDIFVICDPSKITPEAIVGSPDLVVEILSPSNSAIDPTYKLELYEEYEVPEYWIVDSKNKSVVLYLLVDGSYQAQKPKVPGDLVASGHLPGLKIDVAEIFMNLPGEKA